MRARLPAALLALVLIGSWAGAAAAPSRPAPAASVACDRDCLKGFADLYVAAMTARDPTRLPLAAKVRFTENETALKLGQGAWKTAVGFGDYRIYAADPRSGQVALLSVLKQEAGSTMFAVRLKVVRGRISEVETIVPGDTIRTSTYGQFMTAPDKLTTARPGFAAPLKPSERRPRAGLVAAANSYYDGIKQGSGDVVAFADDCHRIENGVALVNNPDYSFPVVSPTGKSLPNFSAMGCREQFNTGLWNTDIVSARRFPVVDEATGVVVAFTLYHEYARSLCTEVKGYGEVCPPGKVKPFTLDLVEAMKVRDGKIHEMESVWSKMPSNPQRSLWSAGR